MTAQTLKRHGTEAGYRTELQTDNVCDRCRNAHRVFQKQYTRGGKTRGIRYEKNQVIDHLYKPGQRQPARPFQARSGPEQVRSPDTPSGSSQGLNAGMYSSQDDPGPEQDTDQGPTLADRVGEGLRKLTGNKTQDDYISTSDIPDYLHEADPDPEPSEEWAGPESDDFVITKAGMVLIEENLGTYMSVVGITLEMIDPYCGPILAENFDNIINRWTKVITRYPRAAKLFMSKDGGTIFAWIGAIQATWPVLLAIYDHHLAKNVQTDKEGRAFRIRKVNPDNVDATVPPMAGYDYTVD